MRTGEIIQGASGKHGFKRHHSMRRLKMNAERAGIEDSRIYTFGFQ